ncbi:MAG: hypothetical protein JXR36_03655 [Bacteroidales bacterium]|nr:hypothetical protein [Bacteroidales bacterium]
MRNQLLLLFLLFTFSSNAQNHSDTLNKINVYNVIGEKKAKCSYSATFIGLDNSDSGIEYYLIKDYNSENQQISAFMIGDGFPITFSWFNISGTYSVFANWGSPEQTQINGTWTIKPAPLPDTNVFVHGSIICDGDSGIITIPEPQQNVEYFILDYEDIICENYIFKIPPEYLTTDKNLFRILAKNEYGCYSVLHQHATVEKQYLDE